MKDRNRATSRTGRRPVAAFVAALLAFALAFMAFEPNALRSAFADGGEAASADATQQQDGLQATEPAEGELEEGSADDSADDGATAEDEAVEEEAPAEEQLPVEGEPEEPGDAEGGNDARAGPDDEEESGQPDSGTVESEDAAKREQGSRAVTVSCTVTFFDNVASANPSILARKLVSAEAGQSARVDVSDVVASAPASGQVFEGWLFGGETVTDSIQVDPRDGDVRLYPSFSSGHWLRYTEGEPDSGAVAVSSQFVGVDEAVPATLPVTSRAGYAFEGWHEGDMSGGKITYGQQVTDGAGIVLDAQELRVMLAVSDVRLYAKWRAVETSYRLIVWYENPDDDGYTYQYSKRIGGDGTNQVISGETTNVSQVPEVAGFTAKPIAEQPIAGDGSTVVHAYYDRNEYSVYFHKSRVEGSETFGDLTITDKYGADIHDDWPDPAESGGAYTAAWYTLPGEDTNVFVTGIGTMPLGGAHYYLKDDTGLDCNTVFMVQDVNGENEFAEYVSQPFSTENSPTTTADDYKSIKGFMVNADSQEDALAIQANPAGDKAATYNTAFARSAPIGASYAEAPKLPAGDEDGRHTLTFYYLRCQYDIVFEENGGYEVDDVEDVYYEASLAGRDASGYVVGETTYTAHDGELYEFAGWFDNPEFEKGPFDFQNAKMPAGNVVLYAKWVPAKHLVQVDPDGGEFTNPAQSTYFWVAHGEKVPYIDVERHYVADDDGEFVYDYETVSDDTDKFGNAVYVTAQSGDTGQRYSRQENAYSLFGWFRAGGEARADAPFDFDTAITEDTSIFARWRAAGMFDIAYNPTMEVAGTTVSGDIDVALDRGYADLSPTYVMNTPENIEASDGDEYTFVGWRVVEHFGDGAGQLMDGLFAEGDGFVVDSELATNNTIHLQAVYEEAPDEPVDPVDPADPDDPTDPADPSEPATPSTPDDSGTSNGGGNSAVQNNTITQQVSGDRSLLPKTGDEARALAIGVGGFALAALGVALIARALRRNDANEE